MPALGIAYRVLNEVERVIEGSPADKAGMKPGDVLVQAKLIPPDTEKLEELGVDWTEDLARRRSKIADSDEKDLQLAGLRQRPAEHAARHESRIDVPARRQEANRPGCRSTTDGAGGDDRSVQPGPRIPLRADDVPVASQFAWRDGGPRRQPERSTT